MEITTIRREREGGRVRQGCGRRVLHCIRRGRSMEGTKRERERERETKTETEMNLLVIS